MTYICVDRTLYQVDTLDQIAEAQAAMRLAGEASTPVYTSPYTSVEEAEASEAGNPDDYPNGQILFAD